MRDVAFYRKLLLAMIAIAVVGVFAIAASQIITPNENNGGSGFEVLAGDSSIGNTTGNITMHVYKGDSLELKAYTPKNSTIEFTVYMMQPTSGKEVWKIVNSENLSMARDFLIQNAEPGAYAFNITLRTVAYGNPPTATVVVQGPRPIPASFMLLAGGSVFAIIGVFGTSYALSKYSRESEKDGKTVPKTIFRENWRPKWISTTLASASLVMGILLLLFGGTIVSYLSLQQLFPLMLMAGVLLLFTGLFGLGLRRIMK